MTAQAQGRLYFGEFYMPISAPLNVCPNIQPSLSFSSFIASFKENQIIILVSCQSKCLSGEKQESGWHKKRTFADYPNHFLQLRA